ncbi:unnamed protein product, partial [Amoebophrya sp. A25]
LKSRKESIERVRDMYSLDKDAANAKSSSLRGKILSVSTSQFTTNSREQSPAESPNNRPGSSPSSPSKASPSAAQKATGSSKSEDKSSATSGGSTLGLKASGKHLYKQRMSVKARLRKGSQDDSFLPTIR